MLNWLKRNAGPAVLILTLLIGLVVQWTRFEASSTLSQSTANKLEQHLQDTRRHVDPDRDGERWRDLLNRLDRIERKIDGR